VLLLPAVRSCSAAYVENSPVRRRRAPADEPACSAAGRGVRRRGLEEQSWERTGGVAPRPLLGEGSRAGRGQSSHGPFLRSGP
jgi:hypothetical protein